MKYIKKISTGLFFFVTLNFILSSCTKHDWVLSSAATSGGGDTLFSKNVSAGPAFLTGLGNAWNGTIDPLWTNVPKLTEHLVVPDLGYNTFTGFIGNSVDVTMRSLYDASNIYFLVEWNSNKDVWSAQWYFNPVTNLWAQETAAPVYDANGIKLRPPFSQEQFAMLYNIANSCYDFTTLNCYAACHVNVPTMVMDGSGNITYVQNYGGTMHTNGPIEKLDCWRARMLQVVNANQANDTYIDWANGVINTNAVKSDAETNSFTGTSNKQSITITGKTVKESVPVWIKPAGGYVNSAILASDTSNCKFVIKVDSTGVLHYADARGGAETGTIDPRTAASGTDYQQIGLGDGPKCVPGSVVGLYTGSRADITANAFYTGTGWILMLKRALKTADVLNQDVDFSSLNNVSFGVGLMFNGADNQHAIKPGLVLSFMK